MEHHYGIDLGTCYSLVAHGGELVPNVPWGQKLRSVVGYRGSRLYIPEGPHRPGEQYIKSNKRFLGRDETDNSLESDLLLARPADFDDALGVVYRLGGENYIPEVISGLILGHLQRSIPTPIQSATIGVPAYFSYNQRQATLDAATAAGLSNVRLIDEPVAAAVGLRATGPLPERTLVLDIGAGTTDLSIVMITETATSRRFTVQATAGDNYLGGDDIDAALCEWAIARSHLRLVDADPHRLRDQCEKAKIELSNGQPSTNLRIAARRTSKICTQDLTITREQLEDVCAPVKGKISALFEELFRRRPRLRQKVKAIALVGGSSHLPFVLDLCEHHLPGVEVIDRDREIVVALGASLYAPDSDVEVAQGASVSEPSTTTTNQSSRDSCTETALFLAAHPTNLERPTKTCPLYLCLFSREKGHYPQRTYFLANLTFLS